MKINSISHVAGSPSTGGLTTGITVGIVTGMCDRIGMCDSDNIILSSSNPASFPRKLTLCWNEQVCPGMKFN